MAKVHGDSLKKKSQKTLRAHILIHNHEAETMIVLNISKPILSDIPLAYLHILMISTRRKLILKVFWDVLIQTKHSLPHCFT